MKKHFTQKLFLTTIFFLFSVFTINASTVILAESFDGFSEGQPNIGAHDKDISGALDTYTESKGWTGAQVFQAGTTVKFGTTKALGWIQTPSMNLSTDGGRFKIMFDAMAWNGDNVSIKIYLDGVLVHTTETLINEGDYTLKNYLIELTGGTSSSVIKFEASQAAKGRFFMDNLIIYQGEGEPLSRDAYLSDLKVDGITLEDFSPNQYNYKYMMVGLNDITHKVGYTISSNKASALMNKTTSEPEYSVKIDVTAEDGTVRQYTIDFVLVDTDGSEETPFSITDAKKMQGAGMFWVEGRITGQIDWATGKIIHDEITKTNLALSTDNGLNYISVQLPSGYVKNDLNVVDNPNNLGLGVKLYGNLAEYCFVPGLKNVAFYEFVELSSINNSQSNSNKPNIFSADGFIHVTGLMEQSSICIYDLCGKVVLNTFSNTDICKSFPKGMYIVKVISDNEIETKKVYNY